MPPEEQKKLKKQQDEQLKESQSGQQHESQNERKSELQHGVSLDSLLQQIQGIEPIGSGNQNNIDALLPEDDEFSLDGEKEKSDDLPLPKKGPKDRKGFLDQLTVFGEDEDLFGQPSGSPKKEKSDYLPISKASLKESKEFLEQMSVIEDEEDLSDLPLSSQEKKESDDLLISEESSPESKVLSEEDEKQGKTGDSEPLFGSEEEEEQEDDQLFGSEDNDGQEDLMILKEGLKKSESRGLSKKDPKKGGVSGEEENTDVPASAIDYERVPDKVRKELTGKKAGAIKALLAGKPAEKGIEAVRKKFRLTAEEMKDPEAVPRMTEPYFRTAISDLSKDKSLTAEQQKALSDFSEEMDQQMMINAMKAPGREQIQNLRDAFWDDEESRQVGRELKAHRIGKLLFGEEGFKSNFRSMFSSPKKAKREDVDRKTEEEQTRQKESARSLLKIFLMLQIGNMQKRETDQETGEATDTDWDHNMSDLFAHGGRIVIETGDQSADPEKKDSVGDVMASVFSGRSTIEKRDAATHYIGEGDMGEFREEQGYGAAWNGSRDAAWENYGMPVAIGGSGSKGPMMYDGKNRGGNRIIRNDNRNGHLYVGKKEGSVKKHGGFLIGLESDAPYRMNQWGHVHTMLATPERIKSTGGMKKDLHGDKVSGRNLDLGGMKNEDLVRLMQDVDAGFETLYGSEEKEKQQEYDGILRQLTGKRLEAEAVEEILKKLTGREELGISVEKIRSESRGLRPILPKELMDEPVEEPDLTPEEKKRREERDEKLKRLLPDDPSKWHRFEVEESSGKDPVGPKEGDMVSRFLAAQGKSLQSLQEEAEKRARKKEEEKKKHGDPYAGIPLDAGPLFYEDDKSPEAKKEYEEANRKAAEKLKKERGGDQVYDPEKVGQEWLYDRDENGRYYSAQVSSDPTHFGKHHKLDTSAYLILADQVIRVDDYIAGRTTSAEEKAVTETKPVSGETALVPAGGKFTEFSETMQKNCMEGIENLRKFMEQYAPSEEKEAWQKLFSSIELYEKALSTGQPVEPDTIFRSIPAESITFRGSYDLRKLVETGITNDQLGAVHKFLEITDTQNPAILGLSDGIAAVQRALAGAAGGLKRLPAPGKALIKNREETGGLKLISDNPFKKISEETIKEPPEEKPDFDFSFDANFRLDSEESKPEEEKKEEEQNPEEKIEEIIKELTKEEPKQEEKKEEPKTEEKEEPKTEEKEEPKTEEKEEKKPAEMEKRKPKVKNKKPRPEKKKKVPKKSTNMFDLFNIPEQKPDVPRDISTDVELEKQLTGASCYAYVAAALLRHFGQKYQIDKLKSVKERHFPKAYGVKRKFDGNIYPRGKDEDSVYFGYQLENEKTEGFRNQFPLVSERVGLGYAQDMNDIVESIHQMSGGKAALNSKNYYSEDRPIDVADLKKTVSHVLNDRKMPVGLFCTKGGTGHYILVVGADENGITYKDPLHNQDKVKKGWDSLKQYRQVSIKFLQHTQDMSTEMNPAYRSLEDDAIQKNELFPDDLGEHFKYVDAYAYNDGKYSYQSILPKKRKKK